MIFLVGSTRRRKPSTLWKASKTITISILYEFVQEGNVLRIDNFLNSFKEAFKFLIVFSTRELPKVAKVVFVVKLGLYIPKHVK